ncbi:MAG: oligopeptidase A [Sideroxydans sp.]|nr:oligopeptidase A [Sideroxydans sp.]
MNTSANTNNPLLDFSGLPRFAEVQPEHVTPAVEQLLAENRALVATLLADTAAPGWDSFMRPLDDANERLSRAWGQVAHLNAVMNSPALREAYNANLSRITQYYAELGQNLDLFNKVRAIRNSAEYATLSAPRQKIIENELRDFRLGGAELPEQQKARFLAIQEELSALDSKFSDNLLDATNAYSLVIEDQAELAGIPADDLQAAQEAARAADKPGWLFTLKAPSFLPVMQYADNRDLRARMYRAYCTRASEFDEARLDNTPLMIGILKLRAEEARLLGFANYAELSLASKMADTPQQIMEFLRELAQRARPFAERDLAELREFAKAELGIADLQAWDVSYASEHLRQQRYAFSEQEVKQYFPEDAVLSGMFRLLESLYGLQVRASQAPLWHDDVRFFDILDGGDLLGQFYLDLYARNSKRGGAWMDDAVTRRRTPSGIQTPVAYLNCNFAAPVGGKPALFTHDEVITLFHEFGHGLHHLLTQVEELGVSGINGVEWDAVELPSQFMENFCWEWDVLQNMTRHVDSGASLPRALFDKMLAAKNFQSGLQTLRQVEFALFDMRLHVDYEAGGGQSIQQLLDEVRKEVAVIFPPEFNRFPNSFSHIFAGGYAAGYYSYKWAEVLSADAYSLFEESGVLNPVVGNQFRSEILAMGGSRDAMASFVAFRGREPGIDALLRHNGLLAG